MKIPFRDYHLLNLLNAYEAKPLPLDSVVYNYFRSNKSLGSKDRAEIGDTVFQLIRWKELLDYLIESPLTWEKRLEAFRKFDLDQYRNDSKIPPYIRVSFPEPLFDQLLKSHGLEETIRLCQISNTQAPVTVRVNASKISREELLSKWGQEASPCSFSKNGISFQKRFQIFQFPEFKQGLFEVQDEGSQLLAELVKAKPGDQILDYCAGSGGKTLAFAPEMQNKGQIHLHDVRPFILQEAKKRLKRAGVQNAQIVESNDIKLKTLKKKMDWVLVDVPCSGTGTLRRNPDLKWKYSDETLERLIGQQRLIFEKALSFLHPEGRIVYGTCSLLKEENEEQIAHFLKTYQLESVDFLQTLPIEGGMDGFFGAVMRRKDLL